MRKNEINLKKEHDAIRNAVGYYDFTHQLLEVMGPDSGAFLDYLFVNKFSTAKVGSAKYTTMLNEDGVIIDDVIIFRIKEEQYWISTLYIDDMIKWFDAHKGGFDVFYKDITEYVSMVAVQGPKSGELLNALLKSPVDKLKYFTIEDNFLEGMQIMVARSGFTGELGYELYVDPPSVNWVEEQLEEKGADLGVQKMTTDVILTSLPREKGYTLMSDLGGANPLEVGFDWTVGWDKDFIGKAALEKVKADGPKRKLLGFTVADDKAVIEENAEVTIDDKEVGKVTTFTYGYTVGKNIGFALVDAKLADIGDEVEIDGVKAVLADRMFYDPDNKKIRG